MARILALDYGRKRTGIAVSDPLRIIANGLTTIPSNDLMTFLEDYFKREQVDTLVVGYPRQMNNMPSEAVKFIDPLIRSLKKKWPGKMVVPVDERFTSKMAFHTMIESGIGKKARQNKALIDTISATIILQSYMETLKTV